MAGDLKASLLHRWVWLCPENKGLDLSTRQGDGIRTGRSSVKKKMGKRVREVGGFAGTGGRLLRDGQLHHDSGSH